MDFSEDLGFFYGLFGFFLKLLKPKDFLWIVDSETK